MVHRRSHMDFGMSIDPTDDGIGVGDSDEKALGIEAFVAAIDQAMAWDLESMRGYAPVTGAGTTAHAVPYDTTAVINERNGVTVTSFPVIHALNGAVGFRVDYEGQSVVFSGDTKPTMTLVEASQRSLRRSRLCQSSSASR